MKTTCNWFKSSKSTVSSTRRNLSPIMEAVEDRKLMTAGCGAAGFLTGSVLLDGNGAGVSCVKIDLYKADCTTPVASQITDCNGQYTFTGLNPGDYLLKETVPCGYNAVSSTVNSELNAASSVDSKTIKVTVADPAKVYVNYGGIVNGSFGVINDVVKGTATANSVGPMSDTLGTSVGDTSLNGGFATFCVNDLQSLSFGGGESYQVNPRPISQLNDGSCTISTDHSGRIAYLFNHYGSTSLDNVHGSALQVAIWELLYDKGSTPDFSQGAFQVTGSDPNYTDQATLDQIITQAKAYYNESAGHSETAVFLDAASANPGQIKGLQSVLCTEGYNFTIGKPLNQCDLTNVHYVINGSTVVTDLRGNIHPGDTVEADFTVPAGESGKLSLVSYTAPQAYFDANTASRQKVFAFDTETFGAGSHSETVTVPNGNFQVDFVCGDVITTFGPAGSNNFYHAQNRFISGDNGGPAVNTGTGNGCDNVGGQDQGNGSKGVENHGGSGCDTGHTVDNSNGCDSGHTGTGDSGKGGSGCDTGHTVDNSNGCDSGHTGTWTLGSGTDCGSGKGFQFGTGRDNGYTGIGGSDNGGKGSTGCDTGKVTQEDFGSTCSTGGWSGGFTSACNVGSGKGWSQGNTFSWCKI